MDMDNYPAGSMRGSGIYAEDIVATLLCPHCQHFGPTDVYVDDFRNGTATCPKCSAEFTPDYSDEPDYGDDDQYQY